MKRKMRKYRDYLIEKLADREKAVSYLQTALEEYQTDGDMPALLLALRSVVEAQGGIGDEYQFDYSKAKPNRFADKIGREQLMVVLDQDVAAVFKTSESVNQALRAIITPMPIAEKGDS